jgi:hypothetical protein
MKPEPGLVQPKASPIWAETLALATPLHDFPICMPRAGGWVEWMELHHNAALP